MKISLLPYAEIDGVWNIPDPVMKRFFDKSVEDGSNEIVFYEGTISDSDQFLAAMKQEGVLFYAVMEDGYPVGYTWLNRFENHTARNHFCGFKEIWGRAVEVGSEAISQLIRMQDKDGNYLFDLFTGFIPEWNVFAIKFMFECGAKSAGIIPQAIWNNEKKKSENAIFFYYTRCEVTDDSQ